MLLQLTAVAIFGVYFAHANAAPTAKWSPPDPQNRRYEWKLNLTASRMEQPSLQSVPSDKFFFAKVGEETVPMKKISNFYIDLASVASNLGKTCACFIKLKHSTAGCTQGSLMQVKWVDIPMVTEGRYAASLPMEKLIKSCEREANLLRRVMSPLYYPNTLLRTNIIDYSTNALTPAVRNKTVNLKPAFIATPRLDIPAIDQPYVYNVTGSFKELVTGMDKVDIGYPPLTRHMPVGAIVHTQWTKVRSVWNKTQQKVQTLRKILTMLLAGKMDPDLLLFFGYEDIDIHTNDFSAFHKYDALTMQLQVWLHYYSPESMQRYNIYKALEYPIWTGSRFQAMNIREPYVRIPVNFHDHNVQGVESISGEYLQRCSNQGMMYKCERLSRRPHSHQDSACVLGMWNGDVEQMMRHCTLKNALVPETVALSQDVYIAYLPNATDITYPTCNGLTPSRIRRTETAQGSFEGSVALSACGDIYLSNMTIRRDTNWIESGHHTAIKDAVKFISYLDDAEDDVEEVESKGVVVAGSPLQRALITALAIFRYATGSLLNITL